jgi:hypothetical protein
MVPFLSTYRHYSGTRWLLGRRTLSQPGRPALRPQKPGFCFCNSPLVLRVCLYWSRKRQGNSSLQQTSANGKLRTTPEVRSPNPVWKPPYRMHGKRPSTRIAKGLRLGSRTFYQSSSERNIDWISNDDKNGVITLIVTLIVGWQMHVVICCDSYAI